MDTKTTTGQYGPFTTMAPAHAQPCPSCGHCPTCGRGGRQAVPYYYPWWQQPFNPWPEPHITWTLDTRTQATVNHLDPCVSPQTFTITG